MNYTQNRELSWLKFNERVLSEAVGNEVPIFERLKFVAIFTSNLDEFFRVRVGSLFDLSLDDDKNIDNKTGLTPTEQLGKIYEAVEPLYRKRDAIYEEVMSQLAPYGIKHVFMEELTMAELQYVTDYYENEIKPILSPQVIDTLHPFPFLANKNIYIILSLNEKKSSTFGILPVPPTLPDVIYLPGDDIRYIRVCEVIFEFSHLIFEKFKVKEKNLISITRNADISPDDEDFYDQNDSFRDVMKRLVKKRRRLAPVRIESHNKLSERMCEFLCRRLELNETQTFVTKTPSELSFVFEIEDKIPEKYKFKLCHQPFYPQITEDIVRAPNDHRDLLLSYPFESMQPYLDLVRRAATDPNVISIKITIYRLAKNAKLVEYLCTAAENGKEVLALIELRARFDEQNNIDWSERLEQSGVRVIYGFDAFKVHSKITLITLTDKNGPYYITQVGTGNFNEKTAKMYTDLCLITHNQEIGVDAAHYFKNMCLSNLNGEYKHLLVAPNSMKNKILDLIDEEIAKGEDGNVTMKVNSVTDIDIIEKLCEASLAGVSVKMLVRGICCLLPRVKDYTDNIEIISIVGRYLEHTRIYIFGKGDSQKMYISSADFMTRNMVHRVEVACPIYEPEIKHKINHILNTSFQDTVKARKLNSNGDYEMIVTTVPAFNSQRVLISEAAASASRVPEVKKSGARTLLKRIIIWLYEKYVDGEN